MTIGGIGGAAQPQATSGVDPASWQTQMQQTLGPVAQLFGESTQQLMTDLQSGKTSLSQLAQSKGISQTDLLNAIEQGLQESSAANGTQLSGTQLTNLANGIANRVHGHHHHHRGVASSGATAPSGTSSMSSSSSTAPLGAVDQDLQQVLAALGVPYAPNGDTASAPGSANPIDTDLADSGQAGAVDTAL